MWLEAANGFDEPLPIPISDTGQEVLAGLGFAAGEPGNFVLILDAGRRSRIDKGAS